MERLTDEQRTILRAAETGHNIFITGQAGTGKTFLVKEIYRRLRNYGKNVSIICSSGVAASVYDDLKAPVRTVHAFYGLETADLPSDLVVDRSLSKNLVRERVQDVDVLIWDEISMSSRRIFQLVNAIHAKLSLPVDSKKPFGGKQMILVGEYLQLRPVPNIFDEGSFSFQSKVFEQSISHRFELTKILRQDSFDFVSCLKEIRDGSCSPASTIFLQGLERNLASEHEEKAVHIFFRKLSAQVFNIKRLHQLPGNVERFDAVDEGRTKRFDCPAQEVLLLKPGCKVMLIWNKTEKLRNGTPGIYKGMVDENNLVVEFESVGRISIKKEIWEIRSKNGEVIGCRKQFPLILMYAVTCHKSQGLTLPAAVVHCSKEFVPGLIYVSLTRVRRAEHLQIKNFHPCQLLPPHKDCITVCNSHVDIDSSIHSFRCCREVVLSDENMTVHDSRGDIYDTEEEIMPDDTQEATDRIVGSFFERGELNEQVIDLETVYLILQEDVNQIIKTPPKEFNVKAMLQQIKVPDPLTSNAKIKNDTIDGLINNTQIQIFGNILWSRASKILIEDTLLNLDEIQVSTTQWTMDTRQLFLLITRSPEFLRDIKLIFSSEQISHIHIAVCSELLISVYKLVVASIVEKVKQQEFQVPVVFNVTEMPNEGLAKVRYIGAWAIRKVFNQKLKYVKDNCMSLVSTTRAQVDQNQLMCELLEEFVIAKFPNLQKLSKYPETLSATEDRQYRCRGLFHIEDKAYEFFVAMESQRVKHINENMLLVHREDLIDYGIKTLEADEDLLLKWKDCFQEVNAESEHEAVKKLYHMVVQRFVMVGAGQYMKDYRTAHRLKKSAEHRKKVLQRKQHLEEKKSAVTMSDIMADRTTGKSASHFRLLGYFTKYGRKAFITMFKKNELQILCKAYGITYKSKASKEKLAQDLIPVMKSSENIPNPCFVTPLESNTVANEERQRVELRINRQQ